MEIAYVLVKSEIAHEMEVLNEILKFDGVKEVKGTFGLYDIFVKIEASSSTEIQNIITKKNVKRERKEQCRAIPLLYIPTLFTWKIISR